jgi:hypothetical protein
MRPCKTHYTIVWRIIALQRELDGDIKMKLTFLFRLKLCYEILTIKSGHKHSAQEKQLSTFRRGYASGMKDAMIEARDKSGI